MRHRVFGLLFACLVCASPLEAAYSWKRTVTIDHLKVPNTNQTDFPVWVSVTHVDLKSVSNGGHVQSTAGNDISFFADTALATELSCEKEVYVASTGEIGFWVKVPTLATASDTVIYLAYGDAGIGSLQCNDSATWDGSYKLVYHYKENSGTSASESKQGLTGTLAGSGVTWITGKTGPGTNYDGTSSAYIYNATTTFQVSSDWTIETWIRFANSTDWGRDDYAIIGQWSGNGYMAYAAATDGAWRGYTDSGGGESATAVTPNDTSWHRLVIVHDSANTNRFYLDGSLVTTGGGAGSPTDPATPINIGTYSAAGGAKMKGDFDETRLSNAVRSADWIATDYNNQNSPGTFFSLGSETAVGGGGGGGTVPRLMLLGAGPN